jgi:hypothetical protein
VLYLLALLLPVPGDAQASDDLRQRYGPPDDRGRYVVRPHVTASVTRQSDGRASRILIEARGAGGAAKGRGPRMLEKVAAEVIDELSPADGRGALLNSLNFSAGCTSIRADHYERVRISRVFTCDSPGTVKSAEIAIKALEVRPDDK